jgi:hypothetical protein
MPRLFVVVRGVEPFRMRIEDGRDGRNVAPCDAVQELGKLHDSLFQPRMRRIRWPSHHLPRALFARRSQEPDTEPFARVVQPAF